MKSRDNCNIDILNTPISDLYKFNSSRISDFATIELKAILLTHINQLERVFLGVFGKPFKLEDDEDISLFKEVFPFLYCISTKETGNDGVKKLCSALSTLRNLNAHAYADCDFKTEIDLSYVLKAIPNYSATVKYLSNEGIPTVAGIISILLFFSNEKAISYFVKNDIWTNCLEHLNYFGNDYIPNLFAFADMVGKTNQTQFETLIRKPYKANNIFEAIFGRFYNKVIQNGDKFSYSNEEELEDSAFHISLLIKKNANGKYEILVEKGSNYNEYFREDYSLTINDLDDFISNCCMVPPFMFLVYLYKAKVNFYTTKSLNDEDRNQFIKLNKPKFYVDKNINSLFIPKTISDLRMVGQITSVNLNYCFMIFEYSIYKRKQLDIWGYSSFRNVLKFLALPEDMINQMVSIRNFFAHYYILGDIKRVGSKGPSAITVEFILNLFKEFAIKLKEIDWMVERDSTNDLFYRLCCNLLLFKYSDVLRKTQYFLNASKEKAKKYEVIAKTMYRIQNSCLNKNVEKLIKEIANGRHFIYNERKILTFKKHTIVSEKPLVLRNGEVLDKTISFITIDSIKLEQIVKFKKYSFNRVPISEYLEEFVWTLVE